MGILNQIWWLSGFLIAAPLAVPGVESVLAGSHQWGAMLLALALFALFLPEYIRWRLFGGSSPFEKVPLLETRAESG